MADIFDQVSGSTKGDIFDTIAPAPKKKGLIEQGFDMAFAGAKYAGGTVVGAGEIAANLATQTYGLPARGYGEIANLVTGRTDLAEKTSKALIYEPQTEQGREGMEAIGKAFEWWHEKSMAVGTPVQEAVTKIAGETAGNVAGATVASTMETAPLFVGGVFGKAKGKIAERRAAKDQAIIRDTLAKEKAKQSETDLARASLGDVIPEDPVVAAATREVATRQVSGDIFDRIQRGYLGEEVAKPKPEVTPYDEFVMGRTPTAEQTWESQGLSVYDRINRGYLGDAAAEASPQPFVAPQVQEYGGLRQAEPKQLTSFQGRGEPPPPPPPVAPPAPISPKGGPQVPPAPQAVTEAPTAAGTPEFWKAEGEKLDPGNAEVAGPFETSKEAVFSTGGMAKLSKGIPQADSAPTTPVPSPPKAVVKEAVVAARREGIPLPQQKKYLVSELEDLRKKAPDYGDRPKEMRVLQDTWEDAHRDATAKHAEGASKEPELIESAAAAKNAWDKYVAAGGTVTIEVPGDGVFTVHNTKEALSAFAKRVQKEFPSKETPRIPETYTKESPAKEARKVKPTGMEDAIPVEAGVDWHTNGHMLVKGKPQITVKSMKEGRELSKKGVDQVISVAMKAKPEPATNIEYVQYGEIDNFRGKHEAISDKPLPKVEGNVNSLARIVRADGTEVHVNQNYFLYVKKHFPNAKVLISNPETPVVFKQGSEVVGLIMPVRVGDTVQKIRSELKGKIGGERGSSPELAHAARQVKEFFVPLSTIPQGEAYMILRHKDLLGGLTRVDRIIGQLSDRFKGLSITDKADVFNTIRGEIPMSTIPVELQTIAKQTRADLDRVGKMLVRRGMLKQEVFDAHKDNYIHYMYLRHILPDEASIPVGRGGRMDLSYLKARKDLPESVRKELGLIEDVSVAAPVGMGKALGDVVKADFFKKVAANPEWVWQPSMEIAKLTRDLKAYKQIVERGENVGPDVVAKYRQLEADLATKSAAAGKVPADFIQLPDTKAYGDLQGAFVRKEIANDIVPVYNIKLGELEGLGRIWNKAGKGFDMGMTMFKVGKVALNPPTMIRNTFSNLIQMNMSGIPVHRVPGVLVDGVQSMIAKDKYFRTMERYGGFKTNFSVAELGEVLKTFQNAKGGSITKFFGAVTEAAKYYGKIDDIAKMSLFKDAVTRQGMSTADAALYAQKWGMDYSLASRSVKHARRYALPFVSYQYKIAPLIAETIAKRPWVLAKYAAIPYLMAQAASVKYDWTDKDLDKAQKMMLEKTKGQGAYMLLPVKDNKGNIEIVNMEYFMPWGNILEMARDVTGGNYLDVAKKFGGIAGPYGNIAAMITTKRENEPPKDPWSGRPVYSKLDSPQDKYLKQTEWWWKVFGPDSFSSGGALGYTYKAAMGEKDRWGVEATGMKALGRWMGVNIGSLDNKSITATRKFKIRELDAEIHRIYRDPKYSKEDRKNALRQLQIERKKILSPE